MVRDNMLQVIKQERKEVGASIHQGRVSGGNFVVHELLNGALVLTSRTAAIQIFPWNFIPISQRLVLWSFYSLLWCTLSSSAEFWNSYSTLLELFFWEMLVWPGQCPVFPGHILDGKVIWLQKVVCKLYVYCVSPASICWPLGGFFLLQLTLEKMTEFGGNVACTFLGHWASETQMLTFMVFSYVFLKVLALPGDLPSPEC